jgi:mono/diheme cytochrome c family protein
MSKAPEMRGPRRPGRAARQNSGAGWTGQWARAWCFGSFAAICNLLATGLGAGPALAQTTEGDPASADPVERGAYIFAAAGCAGCHTDPKDEGALLAGGRALETPFGTFYSPNITPDPETGIGRWTDADFARALRDGVAPDGSAYFPVFPYTSFTMMTDGDIADLWAYMQTVPAVVRKNRAHDANFPFGWRGLLPIWRWLNFEARPVGDHILLANAETSRGAYLVNALGHCGECHTPRDMLGALDRDAHLSGTRDGPEGGMVPNITPDETTGIGRWSDAEIMRVLETGMLPDYDVVGSGMGEVVRNSTSLLTQDDRAAIVAYLRTLPAISNPDAKATQPEY